MKMRRAIARAFARGMAAESNGLALPVAAIGIAAIASLEIDKREQARFDADATEFDRLDACQHRHGLHRLGIAKPARSRRRWRARLLRHPMWLFGLVWTGKPMRLPRPIAALRL